jgi:hypothetical protein
MVWRLKVDLMPTDGKISSSPWFVRVCSWYNRSTVLTVGMIRTDRIKLQDLIDLGGSIQLIKSDCRTGKGRRKLRVTAAWKCSEAAMATLVVLGLITIICGACIGAFLKLSFAIRQEDRARGSLRFDPPTASTRAARDLVGISGSRWE